MLLAFALALDLLLQGVGYGPKLALVSREVSRLHLDALVNSFMRFYQLGDLLASVSCLCPRHQGLKVLGGSQHHLAELVGTILTRLW